MYGRGDNLQKPLPIRNFVLGMQVPLNTHLLSCLFLTYLGTVPEFAWTDERNNGKHQHSGLGVKIGQPPFQKTKNCNSSAMSSRKHTFGDFRKIYGNTRCPSFKNVSAHWIKAQVNNYCYGQVSSKKYICTHYCFWILNHHIHMLQEYRNNFNL
jgi:hypothetical protein